LNIFVALWIAREMLLLSAAVVVFCWSV